LLSGAKFLQKQANKRSQRCTEQILAVSFVFLPVLPVMQDCSTHIFSPSPIIRTFGRLLAVDCAIGRASQLASVRFANNAAAEGTLDRRLAQQSPPHAAPTPATPQGELHDRKPLRHAHPLAAALLVTPFAAWSASWRSRKDADISS
jgi:hypothetical protein